MQGYSEKAASLIVRDVLNVALERDLFHVLLNCHKPPIDSALKGPLMGDSREMEFLECFYS